jgi:hypothetical protein
VQAELGRKEVTGRLVHVRYLDHAIFLNQPSKKIEPTVRETVGWLVEESEEYLKIVWDRGTKQRPFSTTKDRDAGIVLVRQLVLNVKEVGGSPEVREVSA